MKIEPHSVQARLQKWGRWRQQPRPQLAAWPSIFGRIKDEGGNAGIHGDGIRYEIIDGVSCPPDGGLSKAYVKAAKATTWDTLCREVDEAVNSLPPRRRLIIETVYIVAPREHPRSQARTAALLELERTTVRESLNLAHAFVADRIFEKFVLLADEETQPQKGIAAIPPSRYSQA